MKLAGTVEVGDVLAATAQKAQVFDAFDMAADIGVLHGGSDLRGYPSSSKHCAARAFPASPASFDTLRMRGEATVRASRLDLPAKSS